MARLDQQRRAAAARIIAIALGAQSAAPASAQELTAAPPKAAAAQTGEAALRAGDFARAARELEAAAKAGNAEAQFRLAGLYRSGRGVAQSDD